MGNVGSCDFVMDMSTDLWARITVVTVTYNSAEVIARCLESVAQAARLIVVDNASRDDTIAIARNTTPKVEIVENVNNRGFGRACNQGLECAETEFVLFLNPDAALLDGAAEALVATVERYPAAAMVAPAQEDAAGNLRITDHTTRLDQGSRLHRRRKGAPVLSEGPCYVQWLGAAVLLARTQAVRAVGGFDENIFLFFEDDDLSVRLRTEGHALVYVPEARASHFPGHSCPPELGITVLRAWHRSWSLLYCLEKHRGRAVMRAEAARGLLLFGLKALGYTLLLNPAKRRRHLARFRGTLAYLMGLPAI